MDKTERTGRAWTAGPDAVTSQEEGLDPADWTSVRDLAHRMIEDLVAFHASLDAQPAWRPLTGAQRERLQRDFPSAGRPLQSVYEEFTRDILPYYFGSLHPRSWGWVNGSGSTLGALAEMWAAAMNSNAWGGEHAASYVEAGVLRWLKGMMGFPESASGVLLSGGSEANLVALAVAREAASHRRASRLGVRRLEKPMVVYASEEVHNSVDKAVGLLGIGWEGLRKVPVDAAFRMDVGRLRRMLREDRADGFHPICVVATAGTVNTGAIDPLPEIRRLCDQEGLWLHVDGAFGAIAVLSRAASHLLRGLDSADSIAFDLHKWLHVPIEAACVLVRDADLHRYAFSPAAAYLTRFDRGAASGPHDYSALGPQLTRGFRALKVWFVLHAYGTAVYGRLADQNIRQARLLARLIEEAPELELLAPVSLNVVCFRYVVPGTAPARLDVFNRELLIRLQLSGEAVVSSTVIGGRFALRLALTNHRTREGDLIRFLKCVRMEGAALEEELKREGTRSAGSAGGRDEEAGA